MQVQRLPASVHKKLDRYVKRCVRGHSDTIRKTHLLRWEVLCKPKEEGGLGIKKAIGMNKALLAKLGWHLLTQGESLWAKTLKSKYGMKEIGPVFFNHKQRASLTWRG